LWFVKNKLHAISIGQSTHQDLVKNSGLRRILFDKSCLRRILIWQSCDLNYCLSSWWGSPFNKHSHYLHQFRNQKLPRVLWGWRISAAGADARQGNAPASTCASVSASLIAASQIAHVPLWSDGLVLPPDWGGDVYSSKELLELRFRHTFHVN